MTQHQSIQTAFVYDTTRFYIIITIFSSATTAIILIHISLLVVASAARVLIRPHRCLRSENHKAYHLECVGKHHTSCVPAFGTCDSGSIGNVHFARELSTHTGRSYSGTLPGLLVKHEYYERTDVINEVSQFPLHCVEQRLAPRELWVVLLWQGVSAFTRGCSTVH